MNTLEKIEVSGFKSIEKMELELGRINVLIGANGAGKSNFISVFDLIASVRNERFQFYVSKSGGSNTLLHYGSKRTPFASFTFKFKSEEDVVHEIEWKYKIQIGDISSDTLYFEKESIEFLQVSKSNQPTEISFHTGIGQKETEFWENNPNIKIDKHSKAFVTQIARDMKLILNQCEGYQFHDTSSTAKIKRTGRIGDNYYLRSDGGNLAAYLYMLQETKPAHYRRIISTIRLAAPDFDDFVLRPEKLNEESILLYWQDKKFDYLLGPHQISDGLLRFMALTTLLLQPEEDLPKLIIIDEPELGLHPYAINLLGSLIRKVSHYCQVIIATQSVNLIDQFDTEDIIVVDRKDGASYFKRLDSKELEGWLKEYSLSELWEKNVIGGGP